jgi:hypothetical protein
LGSIIPYKVGAEFAQRIDGILSDSGLRTEVEPGVREHVRTIIVYDIRAKIGLFICPSDSPPGYLVRIGFRDGMIHRLFRGRDLELAKQVESILRSASGSDIVPELEWLVPDPTQNLSR